jgi:DNA-directed RNA polymerase specialized sigma24 family protein
METEPTPSHLSKISTSWTVLNQAHAGSAGAAATAQQWIMQRYGGAVHRYLLAAVRDPHVADDLTQDFALSLVRGDFHQVQPQRGRFRDYIKTVLFHLVSRYRKRQIKSQSQDHPELVNVAAEAEDLDAAYLQSWREALLGRTWEALAEAQPSFYTVLRFHADHPELPSHQAAEVLGRQLRRDFSAENLRQTLHRARSKFADLLLLEVAQSLESPTADNIGEELRDLNLLVYCQSALARLSADSPGK